MSVPGNGPPKHNPTVPPRRDGSGSASGGATGGASTPKNPRRPPPADGGSESYTPKEEGKPSLADYEGLREVVERLTGEKTDALNEIDSLVAENRRFQDREAELLEDQANLSILEMGDSKSTKVPPSQGRKKMSILQTSG